MNVDCKLKKTHYHHQRWQHHREHYPQQDWANQELDQFALEFPHAVLALGLHFDIIAEVGPPSLDGVQSRQARLHAMEEVYRSTYHQHQIHLQHRVCDFN